VIRKAALLFALGIERTVVALRRQRPRRRLVCNTIVGIVGRLIAG
jgi:hypothetical protein